VQSHLLKGISPTYGPVTDRLVEYGIARLREGHKGQIIEPLAFLSLMKWLETEERLSIEANLRLRLGNEVARGGAFEEVVNLYLLRALRYPVPFSMVFDFRPGCTPPWADEVAHIVARLDNVDVDVSVGKAPMNPGLRVVHYASCIEDIIDWIDRLGTASVLLVASHLFGPDVMARCNSSPTNTTVPLRKVLLMGQVKSYTAGNNTSLRANTAAEALTSLHRDHWFKQAVCYIVSLLSSSH
jgi:hypothetical protein